MDRVLPGDRARARDVFRATPTRTMPKQKFNSVDVAAEVAELRRLVVGSWLANIYDLDDKRTFLLKFTRSGGRTESGEGEKTVVLLESGSRFHSTSYARERKADTPSKLNAKLRMHLRGKRLNDVKQLGADRAVEFVFGAGDTKHALVLELYAQGNLVLLDKNDTILTLLRPVRDDDAGLIMLGNHPYDRSRFRERVATSLEALEAALATGDASSISAISESPDPHASSSSTDNRSRPPRTLREALCRAFGFSPQIADRVASRAGARAGGQTKLPLVFDTTFEKISEDETSRVTNDENEACGEKEKSLLMRNVVKELGDLETWLDGIADGSVKPEGHAEESFLSETNDGETTHTEKPGRWVSESFSPFPFSEAIRERDMDTQDTQDTHTTSRFRLEPRGFDALVDEHFASIERAAHLRARERSARDAVKKADKVKKDQERRAADLLREEAREETRATLIEYNLEKVDAVIAAVNSLLRSGQSWDEIERIVDDERRAGNPVARLVRKLDLANDAVTVGLVNRLDGDDEDETDETDTAVEHEEKDEDEEKRTDDDDTHPNTFGRKKSKSPKSVAVTLDLSLSAYANAREHFERKKKHAAKFAKTVARAGGAIESANRDLEARKRKAATSKKTGSGTVSLVRTPEWFEKFHWFITPENCLVLSARDASQTDALVKKYMGPHDAFVRAEISRAPATIVKAPRSALVAETSASTNADGEYSCLVPQLSLAYAGAACLCRSAAWDTRTVISAWWVPASAVRKTAPNGDPLAPGVVWHVGEKQYLPPSPLVMGYAYAFLVKSEEDVARHAEDRAVRSAFESVKSATQNASGVPERLAVDDPLLGGKSSGSSALDAFLDGSVESVAPDAVVGDAEGDRDDEDEDEDESLKNTDPAPRPGKGRVSAAERRAMKKRSKGAAKAGTNADVASGIERARDGDDGEDRGVRVGRVVLSKEKPKSRADASEMLKRETKKPPPRGKSGKAKRAAAKYAEQDEEDRALAMALLGVKIRETSVERDSKSREKPADDERASSSPSDDGGSEDDVTANVDQFEGDDVTANVDDAADDVDVDVDDAAEEEKKSVSFLERDLARVARADWFTGAPFLETEVTHAVALVAPWDALKAFAYKAKLTPGSQKKGKAAKQALEIVTRAPPAADVMRETREAKKKRTRAEEETGEGASSAVSSAPIGNVDPIEAPECDIESGRSRGERLKPETRREKAARADRDDALKRVIAAAAAAAAAGDGAMLMCGQGVKVSMPAGAAKAMNASRKGGKRGN